MFALKSTYLIMLILIAAGYASGQSCQLGVLTQTERGQLIDVDGSPSKVWQLAKRSKQTRESVPMFILSRESRRGTT